MILLRQAWFTVRLCPKRMASYLIILHFSERSEAQYRGLALRGHGPSLRDICNIELFVHFTLCRSDGTL